MLENEDISQDAVPDATGRDSFAPDALTQTAPPFSESAFKGINDDGLLRDYNLLMSALHVSVSKHLFTEKFEVVWANDFYYEMTGYTREEYIRLFNNNVGDYFANNQEEFSLVSKAVADALAAGQSGYECLLHMPQKGGSYLWIRVVGRFTNETIDGIPVIYATFTSVNDVVQMERERSITYDNLPGFVARYRVTESGLKLLYGNERFIEFFGPIGDAASNELFKENLAFNDAVIGAHYKQLRRGESVAIDVVARSVQGEDRTFTVYADCVNQDEGDPVYLVLYLDTTEVTTQRRLTEEANDRLRELAFVDAVTGGRNATSFDLNAGEAIATAPPNTYALVSVDIQKFKVINDLFGIEEGDRALKEVYQSFDGLLREGEYVARIAADQFNLLLRADDLEVLESRVEDMAHAANAAIDFDDGSAFVLTLNAGIYLIEEPDLPMRQLHDRANVARKKRGGSRSGQLVSCNFYRTADRMQLAAEKDIENRMRHALENHEFIVYLQPKLDLRKNAIAGAEALVRWQDPIRGLVPPGDFIPLFERNGFVAEVDLAVFEQVCALIHGWLLAGVRPLPVSVNLSRFHLRDPRFLDRYEALRDAYSVPASLIEIELTETLVFENPDLLANVIDRIHRAGYRCSMDDFGSGYSSLNVLKDLEVDTLKLDGAFFDAYDFEKSRATDVVEVVVELAKRLRMTTVAEGVETAPQRAFLERVGCDLIQGYLFSPPVDIATFERLAFGGKVTTENNG